jgi:hypothetical protein
MRHTKPRGILRLRGGSSARNADERKKSRPFAQDDSFVLGGAWNRERATCEWSEVKVRTLKGEGGGTHASRNITSGRRVTRAETSSAPTKTLTARLLREQEEIDAAVDFAGVADGIEAIADYGYVHLLVAILGDADDPAGAEGDVDQAFACAGPCAGGVHSVGDG